MKEAIQLGLLALWIVVAFAASLLISRRYLGSGTVSMFVSSAVVASFIFGSLWHPTTLFVAADTVIDAGVHGLGDLAQAALSGNTPALFQGPPACPPAAGVDATIAHGSLDSVGVARGDAVAELGVNAAVGAQEILVFRGWIIDDGGAHVAPASCLIEDGKVVAATVIDHIVRPDVGAALKDDTLTASGFEIRVAAKSAGLGEHAFTIGALGPSGTSVSALPRGVKFEIR